jgi:hypothetical protein
LVLDKLKGRLCGEVALEFACLGQPPVERLRRLAGSLSFDWAGRDHEIYGENLRREFARFGYAPDHLDSFARFLDRLVVAAERDAAEAAP